MTLDLVMDVDIVNNNRYGLTVQEINLDVSSFCITLTLIYSYHYSFRHF